jgi:hypothetical protein
MAMGHDSPANHPDTLTTRSCVARLCHDVVTTRWESGESTGDSKRRFVLVRYLPELLQDNENHAMSDWGSSCARESLLKTPQPCDFWRYSALGGEAIQLLLNEGTTLVLE